jgi:hypothetical protein
VVTKEGAMKRWGTITLMVFAFVVGFTSTYNCGGGSSSSAQDYAPLVHTHDVSDITGSGYISVTFLGGGYNWNMAKVAVDDDDNFANADTSMWWEGLSPSLIDSTFRGVVYADVQLPDGATITEYGTVYYDEIGDSHTVFSQLRRTPEKKGIATIRTTGIAFTPQYAWTTSIDPAVAVVDNSSYSYHIRAQMQGGLDMAVISAMVGYVTE